MSIQIQDADLEARIHRQGENIGARNIEEVLAHLLETQEAQDRWLLENRESISQHIQIGIDQLNRGEGVYEDELLEHMAKLKSQAE